MDILKIILLATGLLFLAILGLAVQIIFGKKHTFPNTHVGGNKNMTKKGIVCAQTWDKTEQKKAGHELRFKKIQLINKE